MFYNNSQSIIDQSFYYIKNSQLFYNANQMTGLYVIVTLAVNSITGVKSIFGSNHGGNPCFIVFTTIITLLQ